MFAICNNYYYGYYGARCQQQCSPNCKGQICDQTSGVCLNGCNTRYSGDKCCIHNAYCEQCHTNTVCKTCHAGEYGFLCEDSCPTNCDARGCRKDDGSCYGCNDPYFGANCEKNCPERCETVVNASRCDLNNGYCSGDCLSGYYGIMCDLECSMNCHNNVCGKDGRSCLLGCAPGYRGSGCSDVAEEGSSTDTATIAGSAVGGIIAIAVAVVLTTFILTKYRRSNQDRGQVRTATVTQEVDTPRNVYDDLNMADPSNPNGYYDVLDEKSRNSNNKEHTEKAIRHEYVNTVI